MTVLADILEQARAQSPLELIAVLAAIAYLALAIRQKITCWLFAAVSTAIYIYLFIDARLYMEAVLNAFYLVMAGYGWTLWSRGRQDGQEKPVLVWPVRTHAIAIAALLVASTINGALLARFSDAVYPYIDSVTTWFAFWATFLVARKVLENWWYWLAIDIASVIIYWSRDLQLTSVLFIVYVIMIPFGFASWRRSMHQGIR